MAAWRILFLVLLLLCGNLVFASKVLQKLSKEKGLLFVHQNICSLRANFESLCALVQNSNIDVITLSETHLNKDECRDFYCIDGYNFVSRCRSKGKGGEVCIYLKDNIQWERREDLEKENIFLIEFWLHDFLF